MRSASRKSIYLIIPLLLLAFSRDSIAGKIPKGDIDFLILQNQECGRDLVSRIAVNIEREMRERGYASRIGLFFDTLEAQTSSPKFISVTVYKSQWRTDKAFSIPYILNRLKRVYEIEIFLEFAGRDGKKIAERINFSQDCGIQAQVLTNDQYDPDLFPDQSSRLMIEENVVRKMAREIADKLGAKLS